MQTVSAKYQELLARSTTWVETSVVVNGVTYGEKDIFSLAIDRGVFSEDSPSIGSCVSATCTLKMLLPDVDIPRQAKVEPRIRLRNGDESSEWLSQGTFYCDEREVSQSEVKTITLNCFDRMLYAEMDCPTPDIDYPATDITMVNAIATALGVSVDSRTTTIMTKGYSVQLPNNYSAREVLGYIATSYGGNFIITPDNELCLVPLDGLTNSHTFNLGTRVKSLYTQPTLPLWDRVELTVTDEIVYASGEGENTLTATNPWGSQQMATDILSAVESIEYQPYDISGAYLDLSAELGDKITVAGFNSVIWKVSRSYGHNIYADVSAPGEKAIDHEIPFVTSERREINRKIATTAEDLKSDFTIEVNKIQSSVSEVRFDTQNDLNQLNTELSSQISTVSSSVTQTAREINERIESTVETINGDISLVDNRISEVKRTADGASLYITNNQTRIDGTVEKFETYFRMESDGLHISTGDSDYETVLSGDRLSFRYKQSEVAYISDNRMYITDSWVQNGFNIGKPGQGKYVSMHMDNDVYAIQLMGG